MLSDTLYDSKHSKSEAMLNIEKLKSDRIWADGEFNDLVWNFYRNDSSKVKTSINFTPIMKFKNVIDTFKCWCIERLVDLKPKTLTANASYIERLTIITEGFDESLVHAAVDYIENENESTRLFLIRAALNFIDYSTLSSKESYMNELSMLRSKYSIEKNARELPNFPDVLTFGSLVDRFIREWTEDEKLTFYPIVLWWKITNIIPLRPSEFCSIQRECIYEDAGQYYLRVPRKKQKATIKKAEVVDTLEINSEIFNLVRDYIELSESYGNSKTLIHYNLYSKWINQGNRKVNLNYAPMYFNYQNFSTLLHTFYSEVIEDKFQFYGLERIAPNDTRHFAFCSMMLQGFNALTIARIGGHRSIESQYHYQQHMNYFIESKVYSLSKFYQFQNENQFGYISNTELTKSLNKSNLVELDQKNMTKMDHGYCTDPEMNCESDACQFCSKWWISKEELLEHSEQLKNMTELKKQSISERLTLIERLRREMEYNYIDSTFNPSDQEALSRETKKMNGEIEDLARIQSNLERWDSK
ncbi:tyrosine-type recombinase/integrase [Paenibacillus taichungensis]|uniref:tyrosine-type recombinase/integrase n=1 Tax=Paenibacillus taichungensis TaxID=484184 RepID=UPI002877AFF1|nr:tyrosine-type recombinase/integrase [Paenibacillus taichungensis]